MTQEMPTSKDAEVEEAARKTVVDEAAKEAEADLAAEVVAEANAQIDLDREAEEDEDAEPPIERLLEMLSEASRLRRQDAAKRIREYAEAHAEELRGKVDVLVDALERPEAQTRWQVLDTLMMVGADDPELVADGFEGAENALFEEGAGSSPVRLSAFRFFALLGKSSPERSDEVWPLLNEAAQVYHGLPEYREMLLALLDFAGGTISEATRKALADRVRFDAEGKTGGFIKTYSAQILDVVDPGSRKGSAKAEAADGE